MHVKWAGSPGVLVAHWKEFLPDVWDVMGQFLSGTQLCFFASCLCHVDDIILFTFFCTVTYFLNLPFCLLNCILILRQDQQNKQVHSD